MQSVAAVEPSGDEEPVVHGNWLFPPGQYAFARHVVHSVVEVPRVPGLHLQSWMERWLVARVYVPLGHLCARLSSPVQ